MSKTQKKQKRSYSGKQKQHALKIQIIYNPNINQIISIRTDKGKTHDLTLARQYIKDLANYQFVLADKGYIGLEHKGLITPIKRYKNQPSTKEVKRINQEINKRRMPVEHIDAKLKVFKILSTTYRNHQNRFGLRVNLIAGIVNKMI